jgi:hypothetical protein
MKSSHPGDKPDIDFEDLADFLAEHKSNLPNLEEAKLRDIRMGYYHSYALLWLKQLPPETRKTSQRWIDKLYPYVESIVRLALEVRASQGQAWKPALNAFQRGDVEPALRMLNSDHDRATDMARKSKARDSHGHRSRRVISELIVALEACHLK